MNPAVRNVGEGPQLVPFHQWALKVRLDGEFAAIGRLDEGGAPRWVEPGVPVESDMQVHQPTLDDPYFTFFIEATTAQAACDTVVQAMAQIEGRPGDA